MNPGDRIVALFRDQGKAGDAFRGHLVIFAVCVLSGAAVAASKQSWLPLLISPLFYLAYVGAYRGAVWIGAVRRQARQKRLMKDAAYRAYVEGLKER